MNITFDQNIQGIYRVYQLISDFLIWNYYHFKQNNFKFDKLTFKVELENVDEKIKGQKVGLYDFLTLSK